MKTGLHLLIMACVYLPRERKGIWVQRGLKGREARLDSRGKKDHRETLDTLALECVYTNTCTHTHTRTHMHTTHQHTHTHSLTLTASKGTVPPLCSAPAELFLQTVNLSSCDRPGLRLSHSYYTLLFTLQTPHMNTNYSKRRRICVCVCVCAWHTIGSPGCSLWRRDQR